MYIHETLFKHKALSDNVQKTRTITPLIFLNELYAYPFVFLSLETCPLYNFQTFADISTKDGTNLKALPVDVDSIIRTITLSKF